MDNSFENRRKYLRIYRNFILTYSEKGSSVTDRSVSQVNNVSKGGINFSSSDPIKTGVVLLIDLKTPFIADALHLEGIILECKEKIPELIYEIRVQFQEVPEPVIAILEKIENYSKSEEEKT